MPYFITDKADGCSGWATIKSDGEIVGCHTTKSAAIKQMVAISLAEKMQPGGERALPGTLRVGDYVSWNSSGGRARGEIERIATSGVIAVPGTDFKIEASEDDPAALIRVYEKVTGGWRGTDTLVGHKFSTLTRIDDLEEIDDESDDMDDDDLDDDETRAINAKVPAYMRAAARRGLEYVAQGKAGDGLKQQTINEARKMASGEISDDKWIRMAAWIARHLGDLDSPEADPQHPNYPSAGVVAHLLWGSGPSKTKARAAMQYAEGVVERIRNEQKRHLPGGHYQKLHGGGGDRNSYMAGNWKQATESEKKDIVREKYAEAAKYTKFNDPTLTPEQKAEKLAQADGQWESRTTNATVYRNGGHTVTFSAKVDSKTQKQILKNVDDLQEKAPLDEIDIQVVSKFNTTVAQKMPRGYAYTTENGKSIVIKSTTAKNNDLYVNPESHPNWHMESSSNTSVSRYVMVHEWGHAVSKQSGGKLDETKVKLAVARGTTAGGTMSEYGSKSAGEAYAEGFAEFFNTDGKSENPVVQELAKEFNW